MKVWAISRISAPIIHDRWMMVVLKTGDMRYQQSTYSGAYMVVCVHRTEILRSLRLQFVRTVMDSGKKVLRVQHVYSVPIITAVEANRGVNRNTTIIH